MSDERKGFDKDTLNNYLISWKEWILKLIRTTGSVWREDDEKAFQEILCLILHQPEIDELYVNKKVNEFMKSLSHLSNVMSSVVFKEIHKNVDKLVRQIISDARGGGKKLKVDKAFVEDWRKRFFLLLVKMEEKGLLDGDDKAVFKAWEANVDNFITEMLKEAKAEIKE